MSAVTVLILGPYLLNNPHEALKGETLKVALIPLYEWAVNEAAVLAQRAKIKADGMPSGKKKGLAKNEERKANVLFREAASRLEIARQLQKRGFTKIRF